MPFYDYRCSDGHLFERYEPVSAPAETVCDECGQPARRVLTSAPRGLIAAAKPKDYSSTQRKERWNRGEA